MFYSKLILLFAIIYTPVAKSAAFAPVFTCSDISGTYACLFASYTGLKFPDGTIQTTASTGGGGGGVSSVAMTVPSFLQVSGSPVTSSGTLAVTLSGTALALANGGTGQTTKAAAFNALSPVTTAGDLILGNGSNSSTRLAIGSSGRVLTSNGTTAAWSVPAIGGSSNQVQFNSSGVLGGSSDFTWNGTQLKALNVVVPTNSAVFFDGGFSSYVGLNPSAIAGSWAPSHVGSNYVAFNNTNAVGWAFGNATVHSIFEVAPGGDVWVNNELHAGSFSVSEIKNTSNNVVISLDTYILEDSFGNNAVDWNNGALNDDANISSIWWKGRVLSSSDGADAIEYDSRYLIDSNGVIVLNWDGKSTSDSSAADSMSWNDRILIANDGATINIDWSSPYSPVVSFTVSDETKWAGTPPADLATAINRIAAVVGNITPIP